MARFRYDEADKYGSGDGAGYFSLKEDKDTARVRIMYNSIEDVECFSVHQLDVEGEAYKKMYVNCLREAGKPLDTCPFCAARMGTRVKLMVPLYNIDTGQIQFWDRGKKFINKLSSVCGRYSGPNKPLVSQVFEIERNGKKGEQTTTYEIYPVERDDVTLEDLPEIPEILGTKILDKTADEMNEYLEIGSFAPNDDDAPVRRSSSRRDHDDDDDRPVRRTPGRRAYN